MTYLESIKARQNAEAARLGRIRQVAQFLCDTWPTWRVQTTETRTEITDDNSTITIDLKADRYVFRVMTSRWVEFTPGDRDLVTAGAKERTEITVAAGKPLPTIARDVERRLLDVASLIAMRLDEEQANMAESRRQGHSVLVEFRAAGWQVATRTLGKAYVYVPDEHPLRALGVYSLEVDPDTGAINYDSRPYLPYGTLPSALINLKW